MQEMKKTACTATRRVLKFFLTIGSSAEVAGLSVRNYRVEGVSETEVTGVDGEEMLKKKKEREKC